MDSYRPISTRSGWPALLWGIAVAALEGISSSLGVLPVPDWAKPALPVVAMGLRFLIAHLRTRTSPVEVVEVPKPPSP